MPKTKILHLIKTLSLGGAETNLLNLVQHMDASRFDIHVGYSFGGELEGEFIKAGARLFKYADESYKVKSVNSIGIINRIRKYMIREKMDIIHTHNFSAHIWGALAAKLARKRIVEHVHDFRYLDYDEFKKRRGYNKQYRFINYFKNVSDRVIVLTRQNSEFLIKGGFYQPERVIELQNGIPLGPLQMTLQEKSQLRNEFGIKDNELVILTPIRIAPEKNMDLILRIAPQVLAQVPNAVFVVAGNGPLLDEVTAMIKRDRLEGSIKLIGFRPDIRQVLGITDIMLLPSFLELHSIAILEAMSMKVPVVVSKEVGCNSEFIRHQENGFLHDPFSDAGWPQTLIALLEDPNLRRKIGNKGHQTCLELFDIRKAVQNISEVYDGLSRITV